MGREPSTGMRVGPRFSTRPERSCVPTRTSRGSDRLGRSACWILAPGSGGGRYPIEVGNHPAWPALFLAALRRELIALPLESSITGSERQRPSISVVPARCSQSIAAIQFSSQNANAFLSLNGQAAPPVLLKLTSGTTALPRAVRFQSDQLLADCDQICETMGFAGTI